MEGIFDAINNKEVAASSSHNEDVVKHAILLKSGDLAPSVL